MPPCNQNATCNMSPVITDLFILFSMANVQVIGHDNGIVKYILKYVAKFDQGNCISASTDIHTGSLVIRSQFLHNTKITSSEMNEDKAHQQSRSKHQLCYRDLPMMGIYQLMLGLPEVTTTLEFLEMSTRSYDVRA